MTLEEAYNKGKSILVESGIDDAAQDALWMLLEVCGIDKAYYLAHGNDEVDITCQDGRESRYFAMVSKRSEHIPLQHILGYTEFMGLRFEVNGDVLIPRQDTETLVEEALQHVHDGMRILDLCTGSGCILISLLNYSNDCTGVGSDISDAALAVARRNAENILSGRTADGIRYEFVRSDLFENIEGRFDMIVSNPPYIRTDVIDTLAPEVRDHDPMIALDGGESGITFYERIVEGLDEHLLPGGCVLFEIGYDQGEAVSALLKDKGYLDAKVIKDYSGNDRVVMGVRSCLIN
jgi:release factor glutamine methyltransferase